MGTGIGVQLGLAVERSIDALLQRREFHLRNCVPAVVRGRSGSQGQLGQPIDVIPLQVAAKLVIAGLRLVNSPF